MNEVPWKYRNVVNPWQTEREILLATRLIERMLKKLKLAPEQELELLRSRAPDRSWA